MSEEGTLLVGLDVGGSTSAISLPNGDIVRNELGGHTSSSLCSYLNQERFIGEAAVAQVSTNASGTILIGELMYEESALKSHRRFQEKENGNVVVNYGDNENFELDKASVLAALVKKLAKLGKTSKVSFAVPTCWDDSQLSLVATAVQVAKLELIAIPKYEECLCAVYVLKHTPSISLGERRVVAMIDIGRCQTTCSIVAFSNPEEKEPETLATVSTHQGVSVAALDAALFDWLKQTKLSNHVAEAAAPGTKKGARLLSSVQALRKLLSTMKEASVVCENLDEDNDVSITLTRTEFTSATESVLFALRSLLENCKNKCQCPIDAVEVLGGGGRVTLFRSVIAEVFDVPEDALGAKLDDASIAHGAALIALSLAQKNNAEIPDNETITDKSPSSFSVDETRVKALIALEDEMSERDNLMALVKGERNRLESLILELRRPEELSSHSQLMNALDEHEDWLWENKEIADPKDFCQRLVEKRTKLEEFAKELCPDYFANLEAERAKTEAEIEASAAQAEKHQDDEDDDERREDKINADTRKLKFSDRMRLVNKNKDEATELFKDGNILHAAKRYKDALGHAIKLDPDSIQPDEAQQLLKMKIDLNVNLSLCWTKLNNLEQSLRACEAALKLDDSHPKALFRRAFVYEQTKRFEEARTDLKRALSLVPEDKALNQLLKRVDAQITRQKKQEKKMWGKAFAS
mmetsp:Transcript_17090/g.22152  ORF Transcript_17090/g.22152 Transcript_17090/m.22152 type:complete len:696 (-) Transcript_17090:226-2313(-)|eukprot:CAMPEP_0197288420 /NCGR_PEP_ID=MMETSP0890-20130614/5501_1 /TAXON_ID=44058 ORGANISM="Aureoumbra lagunensis, Strain CCMP1510" /NCGR_SAMPLE_ID=MMETSP0890 /ASSEMBLY_ACC=CAM_ASM_000533 /LENGTH=695 /DNA_ID=CAMNT_0042759143 /DNA_START=32 /DNA_END=2119 /DNA_ORIENTATION=-